MTPATIKALLRIAGMTLTTLGGALAATPAWPWAHLAGAVIAAVGGGLVAQANRAPGDVGGTDVTAILNAARAVIDPGASITLKPSARPADK